MLASKIQNPKLTDTDHIIMGFRLPCTLSLLLLFPCVGIIEAAVPDTTIKNPRLGLSSSLVAGGIVGLPKQRFGAKLPFEALASSCQYDVQQKRVFESIRGGKSTKPSILSKSLFVVNQTINVATAGLVGSGLLGSWIASIIICKLQKLSTLSSLNNTSGVSGCPIFSIVNRKWCLTITSCGAYFMMKCKRIIGAISTRSALNSLVVLNDIGVLCAIYLFSNVAKNPVLGGLLGCSYVSLEVLASLTSGTATGVLNELLSFRLTPLDEDGSIVEPEQISNHKSIYSSAREIISHAFSSMSLLASMPQYFLILYLLSNITLQLASKHDQKGVSISWLYSGLLGNASEHAALKPWDISLRLLVVHFALTSVGFVFRMAHV